MVVLAAYAPSTYSPTIIVGPLTLNQLVTQYTSANIVGMPPPFATIDAGLQTWNGSAWIGGLAYNLLQTSVRQIFPPSGIMANNGAFTLGTPLDATYASAYMWCWGGMVFTGSSAGWFYVLMTDSTHGTVYNNVYMFGQPIIPSSPTPFVSTGPGAWTSHVNTLATSLTCNVPAFGLGTNGRFEIKFNWTASNTTNAKAVTPIYGGGNLFSDTQSNGSTSGYTSTRTVINKGVPTSQLYSGVNGTGTALGQGATSVNSTLAQSIWLYLNIEIAATDWIVIQYMMVTLYPSGGLDLPAPHVQTPAGPGIVPPGAAALGYTNNVYFINPTLSMVSVGGATPLQSIASLAHYSNATINGVNYLSVNQLGDGTNTACSTNTPSTLPSLPSATGWYYEAAITLTSNNPDHWQSLYANPTERNGGPTVSYVEVDIMEQIGARSATDPFYGNTTSVIDWGSGSGSGSTSDTNNLNSSVNYGPNIDWTQEHIFGGSYDPVGQAVSFWIDGVQMPFTISTAGFNANIATLHYFCVLQAASHTSGPGGVAYSMLVRYFSAWN